MAYKKGHISYWKGKKRPKFSEEWKKNIGNSGRGRVPWNKGTKGVMKAWNKGKPAPWSKGNKHKKGIPAWNKGKTGIYSEEFIQKLRKRFSGKNSSLWKGGITKPHSYYKRIRNGTLSKNGGSHTLGEWQNLKAQYNFTCPCCHKSEPEIKLTEDHIIPISKGGSDNIENIQPLCQNCNSRKYTKIIKYESIS